MQSDIVDFQRQGWKPEEIMAGLCNVLPKNIWLYVSQIPNLSAIGTRFLLQGGTQYNLAAVKAQVDFIESRFKDKDSQGRRDRARALRRSRRHRRGPRSRTASAKNGRQTTFIGLEAVHEHSATRRTRNEDTRCYFCKNKCLRTFIDVKTSVHQYRFQTAGRRPRFRSKPERKRLIVATLRKGHWSKTSNDMREIKGGLDKVKKDNPNLVELAAKAVFRVPDAPMRRRSAAASSRSPPRRRSAPSS